MNRRDFLRLRPTKREREVELSYRTLYLEYLEARVVGDGPDDKGQRGQGAGTSANRFFDGLASEMRDVRLLRIVDRDSITDAEFKRRFGDFVASFRAAGGTVEMRTP